MSSYHVDNRFIMTNKQAINHLKDKTLRMKVFPSKPNYLKLSRISKTLNNSSLHKKCRTNSNQFFTKEGTNKANKTKFKYIFIQNNENDELEGNNNKENININYENKFGTIFNEKNIGQKYKKLNMNNINKIKKGKQDSNFKKNNLKGFIYIKEYIHNYNTSLKEKRNKELIKSKISELSSLKKLIFENNNFKNIKFFERSDKTRNNNKILNISNNINTMNNISSTKSKPKNTNTINLNYISFTEREKIVNRIYNKGKTKSKNLSRNILINKTFNDFNNESNIYEKYNTSNIITNQLNEEDSLNSKENYYLNSNKNSIDKKLFKHKIYKGKIFDKKKLIEKMKTETNTQAIILSKTIKDNTNIRTLRINKKGLSLTENFFAKTKRLKILKKVIKIDSCTFTGLSPLKNIPKINQDNYLVENNFLKRKEHFLLSISSGHGSYGHLISKYICKNILSKIENLTEENIKQSYILTNKALLTESNIDCTLSGASLSTIIITPEKIISANVGNCTGILAQYENGEYNTIKLTRDHNIKEINEMKRILNNGGTIKNEDKIYIKNSDIPGINITRSFGDKLGRGIGILDLPYIKSYYFKGNEKFILLATNGIWKFIDPDESVKIIKTFYENGMDADGALSALVREAILRWKKETNFVEDITAILLYFD